MQRHDATAGVDNSHTRHGAATAGIATERTSSSWVIRTPDQRVRVFISSTLEELAAERTVARIAITQLHLTPVVFESGAHSHPPRALYHAYLDQSAVFVGIYWQRYGWVAPDMDISGLEDEYKLAHDKPKLLYIKEPAPAREPRLQTLIDRLRDEGAACYRRFGTPDELRDLLQDDLAVLLTEYFEQAHLASASDIPKAVADPRDLPSGTVTFLFSDVEGATRLLEQLGAVRYAPVRAEYLRLVREACVAHGGREVDTAGDRFLVAFPSAPQALLAAAQAQRAMASHRWPEGAVVGIRMGLHSGTPLLTAAGYVGLDVNRALSICAAGHGGHVLLSAATRALVEADLPAGTMLRDLGEHRLEGLQQPERVFQLLLPDLPDLPGLPGLPGPPGVASDVPPHQPLERSVHNLPIPSTPLLGRAREAAAVQNVLRQHGSVRLVTLTGPGGVGKTRLALQAAVELTNAFPDGVWYVSLSHLADPELVVATIAATLGVREVGSVPIEQVLREQLRTRKLLLVLDNFEQVATAAAKVAALLASCPGLQVLATSRVALHLRGEHEVPVPPLALPLPLPLPPALLSNPSPSHALSIEQLREVPAVALFVERAQAHRPDFHLSEANAPAVAAICARLDGLPLAIELAAARVKLLPPQQLLARLEHSLPLLAAGTRDLDARQQTMRNTLAWSENLLSSEQQRLFRRLAVFVGGFTLEAAEAVCAQPAGAEPLGIDLLEGLEVLVDHSLVQSWTGDVDGGVEGTAGTEACFRWLYVVREYAQERLEASDELIALRVAHAAYYLALAERSEPELRGAGQEAEWLERVEREYDNLRAALGWLSDRGEVTLALRLAVGIGDFWVMRSHFREGRSWLEGLLATTAPPGATAGTVTHVPAVLQAQALALLGTLASVLFDVDAAAVHLEAALALSRSVGDQWAVSYALGALGDMAREQGDAERAAARYEEMARVTRELGGSAALTQALAAEGLAAFERGDWARAGTLLEQELAQHQMRPQREQDSIGRCLWLLGVVALHQGNLTGATVRLQEAVALARILGNQDGLAYVLEGLAWVAAADGRGERAARLLGAAAARREALGQASRPHFRKQVETEVAPAQVVLGEASWAAEFAAGRELSLEEAIAEALEEQR